MARRFSAFLLTAAALVVLTSCRKATPPAESAAQSASPGVETNLSSRVQTPAQPEATSPAAPTNQATQPAPVTVIPDKRTQFNAKWPVGNRYVYRMDLEQRSTNQAPQAVQPVLEQLTMGVTYALSVLNENADGLRDLELEFMAYEVQIKVGDKTVINFDSARHGPDEEGDPMVAPFRKLIGSKLALQLDKSGKAGRISEREFWLRYVTGDKEGAGELMVAQQFNEGFFQQLAEFGRGLPAEPVEAGASWPYRIEMPAGDLGKIVADSTITLRSVDEVDGRRVAALETKGTLKSVPGPQDLGGLSLEEGTLLGTSWFDPALGAPVESVVTQVMRLKGTAPDATDLKRAGSSFTSDIGQKVTVKLVELTKTAPRSR